MCKTDDLPPGNVTPSDVLESLLNELGTFNVSLTNAFCCVSMFLNTFDIVPVCKTDDR